MLSTAATPVLLPTRANAVHMIHFPEELTDVEIARRRLALDEFVDLQIQIQSRRKKFEANAKALPCGGDNRLMKPFLARLGFKLTGAQTKVLREIRADMGGAASDAAAVARRCRLRQNRRGRVLGVDGAGKRFQRRADGADGNSGGATFSEFQKWFEPLGVKVEIANGQPEKQSKMADRRCEDGQPSTSLDLDRQLVTLFIGTHALFTAGFDLPKLGLVIIDEQHKFGVAQRETTRAQGQLSAFAGDDGHADSAHAWPDALWRSGRFGD